MALPPSAAIAITDTPQQPLRNTLRGTRVSADEITGYEQEAYAVWYGPPGFPDHTLSRAAKAACCTSAHSARLAVAGISWARIYRYARVLESLRRICGVVQKLIVRLGPPLLRRGDSLLSSPALLGFRGTP